MTAHKHTLNTLVLYDSLYGNTEIIARAIATGVKQQYEVKFVSAIDVTDTDIDGIDLLIVGSPTQGGRAKTDLQLFLDKIPGRKLQNVSVAAFDTRFAEEAQTFALRLLMKTIGYAAPKIAGLLVKKGGKQIIPPEGFIVLGKEGPLKNGEIERATEWGETIISLTHRR